MLSVRRVGSALEVSGSLDDEGGRALLSALDSWPGDVHLDAAGINRVDGAGLTALALARFRCRADGRAFALTRLSPDAVRTLRAREDVATLFGFPPSAAPVPDPHRAGRAPERPDRPDRPDVAELPPVRRRPWLRLHHLHHRHDGM